MADPTKYTPSYNFSNWQLTNPTKPLPAQRVDTEYANIANSISQAVNAIKDVRRSDGKLANGSVSFDQLDPALSLGFTLKGYWAAGVAYSTGDGVVYDDKFYSARGYHVSSPLTRPDLSPGTWSYLFSIADATFPPGSLNGTVLTDGTVTTDKLADESVGESKLGAKSVGVDKLKDGVRIFDTENDFRSASISADIRVTETSGTFRVGDGGGRRKIKSTQPLSPNARFSQSDDGAWWEQIGPYWRLPAHHRAGALLDSAPTVLFDGSIDGFHRHFGSVVEGLDGRLHFFYRKAAQHALTSGATIWYAYSDDGGATCSAEIQLIDSVAGADQRGISVCVTPTGRIVLIYDRCPAPTGSPTLLVKRYSDDGCRTWSPDEVMATIPYSYARAYGRIKVIPGFGDYGFKLVATPYYQSSSTPTYKVAAWYSLDNGESFAEGVPVQDSASGENEAEIVPVTGRVWFAALRGGSGIKLMMTQDAGGAWSLVGTVPNTTSDNYVAPTLDKFVYQGKLYVLLGYCDRATDVMTWRVALASELALSTSSFGARINVGTDLDNASGYQSVVIDPSGFVRIDEGVSYVEFKEYVGFPYSQVRFRNAPLLTLSATSSRSYTIVNGAITVAPSAFEQLILVDTEAGSPLDDLDTINGGIEGQVIRVQSSTSARDSVLKNGTGNLSLSSDYHLNNATTSECRLRKCGSRWDELGRTLDQTPTAFTIAAGVLTVPIAKPGQVLNILVDTEANAATDDLDTINGGVEGQLIVLQSATSSRDTTVKNGTGNINSGTDFVLSTSVFTMLLMKRGTNWVQVARSSN